jgi:hypothetical protein
MVASSGDGFSFCLRLPLHAGNRAPGSPTDLGDDTLLLVFRQVFNQKVVSPLQFGITIDLF